ncbi:hypothetical protein K9M79_05885 [Candidatus Woesearchaeota archaeon]|nr:hypothetical protein [Candidatus Woesearchaeota archaeon]
MWDEWRVIQKFKKDVAEHLKVIIDEINKDNMKDAFTFLNELYIMRKAWREAYQAPGRLLTDGSFARGFRTSVDTTDQKHLARTRLEFIETVIHKAEGQLKKKGWIK